jgi:hypothetical protein
MIRNRHFIYFIVVLFLSCNMRSSQHNFATYSRVDIYCWCFYKDTAFQFPGKRRGCETMIPLLPEDLVTGNPIASTRNLDTIKKLSNLIFKSPSTKMPVKGYDDCRFVIRFKKDNGDIDLVSNYDKMPLAINFNGEYEFTYTFDVIDSVRKILGKSVIDCSSD